MNKLIYFISLAVLLIMIEGNVTFAQQELPDKNKDTLIIGGIYKIILIGGKIYAGELLSNKDSVIVVRIESENLVIRKKNIRAIEIQDAFSEEYSIDNSNENSPDVVTEVLIKDQDEYETDVPYTLSNKKKFKMIGSVQAGLAIPTSDFKTVYSTSSGFQLSAYKLFSRVTGLGFEFQYNNFHGRVYYNTTQTYSYEKVETSSYNSSMFKINYLMGDLRPEIDFVFYCLIGLGMQFNSEGQIKSTIVTHSTSYEYTYNGTAGPRFIFGLGIGSFYKVNRTIGINVELQFDKMSADNFYYTGSDGGMVGFYSIKAGIMYTNF
jgi:hypothetical protein